MNDDKSPFAAVGVSVLRGVAFTPVFLNKKAPRVGTRGGNEVVGSRSRYFKFENQVSTSLRA